MSLLKATNLTKSFDDVLAVNTLSLEVFKGKITGLVGPDGAGKTTLIRLISGLLRPDEGALEVLGFKMPKEAKQVQSLIGYMPQKFGLYEDLSVEENLNLYANLQMLDKTTQKERIDELLKFTTLTEFKTFLAGELSGGMKQKLGLACALIKKPKLLLLDEPGVGVDPISRRELWHMVQELIDNDVGVLWSTSYLDEASNFDALFLLNEGNILFQGKPQALTDTMKGMVFKIVGEIPDKRKTLRLALMSQDVKDGVILGDTVKLICTDKEKLPTLANIEAENARYKESDPNFEDGFIHILGADFSGVSTLADQMKEAPMMEGSLIEATNLTKKFGNFTATDSVNLNIHRGEIFGFLGPNGAGKSTTFKMLCGLLTPTIGEAKVLGKTLDKSAPEARAKIGYMSQKFSLYGDIPVIENLRFFAGVYGLKGTQKEQKITAMLDIFNLRKYENSTSKDLPLGYKQRLSLACAVMHDPVVLFLDEPTSGVDPITRREFWNHIYAMVQKGMTIMVTTHFMDEAEYCDRIALIYKGKAIALGTPNELIKEASKSNRQTVTMEDAFIELINRGEHA